MLLWWIAIKFTGLVDVKQNFLYGATQGILPILGAIGGFINSKKWGGFRSSIGKSVIFLSTGLLTWGIGTLVFAYYNIVLNLEVPYPSLADLFYIISWPLWVYGIINLSKATGVKFQLENIKGRLVFFIIPIISIVLSYYLLIVVARDGIIITSSEFLKTFFDLAYPIGDIIILTSVLLIYGLSFKYLGGYFKWPIIMILAGFMFNYFGDFSFIYTVTKETYYVANWVDLLYTIAFFLLSMGIVLMNPDKISKEITQT